MKVYALWDTELKGYVAAGNRYVYSTAGSLKTAFAFAGTGGRDVEGHRRKLAECPRYKVVEVEFPPQ
jgi:hypothetical protein